MMPPGIMSEETEFGRMMQQVSYHVPPVMPYGVSYVCV